MRPGPVGINLGHRSAVVLVVLMTACEGPVQPVPASFAPITVTAHAGETPQSATVASPVPIVPAVRVTTPAGAPRANERVYFTVTRGGGTAFLPEQLTDANGVATMGSWQLGRIVGAQELVASVSSSTTDTRVTFTATATVGVATAVSVTPSTLVVPVGQQSALLAVLRDSLGNEVGPATNAVFASSNSTVLTVSPAGIVTGVALGLASVTVTSGVFPAVTIPVAIGPQPVGDVIASVTISGTPFGIGVSSANVVYYTNAEGSNVGRIDIPSETAGAPFLAGAGPYDIAFAPDGSRAYISNTTGVSISVVDVAADTVLRTIVLPDTPLRLRMSPDGSTLYVAGYSGQLMRVDVATDVVTSLTVGFNTLTGLAFHPTQPFLYATTIAGEIAEVSTAAFTVVRSANLSVSFTQGVAVSIDGTKLFIASEGGALQVRRTSDFVTLGSVTAAAGAFDVALTRNGAQVYVVRPGGSVVILDARTHAVVRTIPLLLPRRVAFDATGTVAIITRGTGAVTLVR